MFKVSGSVECETDYRFSQYRSRITNSVPCGDGSFEYSVEYFIPLSEPGRYLSVHFEIRDAFDNTKAYGYGFIRVNPDQ